MLGFFKQKKVFEGTYWTGAWDLKHFKISANSEAAARELLTKEKDFRFVCVIRENETSAKLQRLNSYLKVVEVFNLCMLIIALMIICGLYIKVFWL